MRIRLDRVQRMTPAILGVIALAGAATLLVADVLPPRIAARFHDSFGAFSLAMVAVAYVAYTLARRPAPMEMVKAGLLAAAFLSWSANQVWPVPRQAVVFNDVAVALFVLDMFLVIVAWPPNSPGSGLAVAPDEEVR